MRTPGHDFELAVGLLHADGALGGASVIDIRYCATGTAVDTEFNVVSVLAPGAPEASPRLGVISSSCGLCGTEAIEELVKRISPVDRVMATNVFSCFENHAGGVEGCGGMQTTGAVKDWLVTCHRVDDAQQDGFTQ